jgi:hypothetical protein
MTKKHTSSPASTTKETSTSTDTRLTEAVEAIALALTRQAATGEKMLEVQQRQLLSSEKLSSTSATLDKLTAQLIGK